MLLENLILLRLGFKKVGDIGRGVILYRKLTKREAYDAGITPRKRKAKKVNLKRRVSSGG